MGKAKRSVISCDAPDCNYEVVIHPDDVDPPLIVTFDIKVDLMWGGGYAKGHACSYDHIVPALGRLIN